jgi:hypothetical protein
VCTLSSLSYPHSRILAILHVQVCTNGLSALSLNLLIARSSLAVPARYTAGLNLQYQMLTNEVFFLTYTKGNNSKQVRWDSSSLLSLDDWVSSNRYMQTEI